MGATASAVGDLVGLGLPPCSEQERDPGAVGAPGVSDRSDPGVDGRAVSAADRLVETGVVVGERVWVSGAADQDELGGERSDARELSSTNVAAAVSENGPRGRRVMVTYAPSWIVIT